MKQIQLEPNLSAFLKQAAQLRYESNNVVNVGIVRKFSGDENYESLGSICLLETVEYQ